MEFKSNRGIFLQIADNLCNQILEGKLVPNARVPSVRDLAVEFEVNRNTVMRSYTYLQDEGIFENKRGVGFFVAEHAIVKIKVKEKTEFFENELPTLVQKIKLLKLNSDDLSQVIKEIKNND
jgi:DNA-binding transcriptional regulator YhcF (GntR family)